jgi:hypothetical protein
VYPRVDELVGEIDAVCSAVVPHYHPTAPDPQLDKAVHQFLEYGQDMSCSKYRRSHGFFSSLVRIVVRLRLVKEMSAVKRYTAPTSVQAIVEDEIQRLRRARESMTVSCLPFCDSF